ncbi:MAG: endonuclease/exonuclease/phosphatase family protein [Candidatus Cloacimonetes bacterium]|nr:endonuclease/exonuclease/phosphatase family protein [Candidatus Cloacimonadota bacterium]
MKKITIILLLISGMLWAAELPKIEYKELKFGEEQTLEIMTWNIQNFPKSEFTINYAAKVIDAIDADIITLQEIESDSAFFCLVNQLNELDNNNWSGYRANRNYWKQELAFIYKTDLIGVDKIYEIFYGDYQPFPRSPLIMEFFYAEQRIILINNHFKARSGAKNEARRREAVNKLDDFIVQNHPNDNIIILGDLNDTLIDSKEQNVFTTFLEKPLEYRFVDLQIAENDSADWSYPYWKYRGHIDHILISNELFDEHEDTGSVVKVVTIDKFIEGGEDSRWKYITDHRPVVIKLKFKDISSEE